MSRATATTFVADAFGKTYTFNCDETITAKGLTHVCSDGDGHVTQKVWGNRPWEGFKYEAVLRKAINKLPEADARICMGFMGLLTLMQQ